MVDIPGSLFFVAFAGIAGFFVYRMFRFGGIKAALFGARIDRTVGEVRCEKRGLADVTLKVHVLRRGPAEKLVGVELTSTGFASYHVMPITLSVSEARQFVSLLASALDGGRAT